jgi:hypothetical protein
LFRGKIGKILQDYFQLAFGLLHSEGIKIR